MSAKNNSVPKRRFKEFENAPAWEQRKVGDLSSVTYGGGTPSTSNDLYWKGTIPWIQSSDLVENQIDGVTPRKHITQFALNNSAARIIPKNSLAIITRVGVGKLAVMPFSYSTSQDFLSLSELQTDIHFSAYSLYKKLQSELHTVQGTSIKGITKDELLSMAISIPTLDEQQKIGTFFRTLDSLITLHQCKLNKVKRLKASYLSEMFPAEGEYKPKRRFKEFKDAPAWEQRELGEVVQITMGQSPAGSTYSDTPSTHILVQGNADLKNGWVKPRVWTTQITKKADAGDLIMSVRAPAGAMGKTAYDAVIGRGVAAIKGNEFIYQLLVKQEQDGFWEALSSGSTFESLNSDNIKSASFRIPNDTEQQKIGAFFRTLDSLITLHQRKLEKLQNIKKAYLHEMFPRMERE